MIPHALAIRFGSGGSSAPGPTRFSADRTSPSTCAAWVAALGALTTTSSPNCAREYLAGQPRIAQRIRH